MPSLIVQRLVARIQRLLHPAASCPPPDQAIKKRAYEREMQRRGFSRKQARYLVGERYGRKAR